MKKTLVLCMIMALAVGTASATIVWSEGFNLDYTPGGFNDNWAVEFGPNILTAAWNTEGDAGSWYNTSDPATGGGAGAIMGGQDFVIGTVAAAGEIYTFTGDFGWQYGSLASANDVGVHASQSGFLLDGAKVGGPAADYVYGSGAQSELFEYSFSYTTVPADIGKTMEGRIRTVDYQVVDGLTQILTDNWQVDVVPEPATLGLAGMAGIGLLMVRRFRK